MALNKKDFLEDNGEIKPEIMLLKIGEEKFLVSPATGVAVRGLLIGASIRVEQNNGIYGEYPASISLGEPETKKAMM